MQQPEISARLAKVAPGLSASLRAEFLRGGHLISAPPGHMIFGPGDGCEQFLIALDGAVRVEHMSASGRSVVLYRVSPGGHLRDDHLLPAGRNTLRGLRATPKAR